jgi:hypothetical protein
VDHHERLRVRAAAYRAARVYPGAIGDLVHRELLAWDEFGYRLGSHTLIMGLVAAVEVAAEPEVEAA